MLSDRAVSPAVLMLSVDGGRGPFRCTGRESFVAHRSTASRRRMRWHLVTTKTGAGRAAGAAETSSRIAARDTAAASPGAAGAASRAITDRRAPKDRKGLKVRKAATADSARDRS